MIPRGRFNFTLHSTVEIYMVQIFKVIRNRMVIKSIVVQSLLLIFLNNFVKSITCGFFYKKKLIYKKPSTKSSKILRNFY